MSQWVLHQRSYTSLKHTVEGTVTELSVNMFDSKRNLVYLGLIHRKTA